MDNAKIALQKIKDLHAEIVSLDSSNTSILKETRTLEFFIQKAARNTGDYRRRLQAAYDILEAGKYDFAITNGIEDAGMDKNMIEDLMFARTKPIDRAMEHLRDFQQTVVDITIAKRDLLQGTKQLERQLQNSSEKIILYEKTLSQLMTFLANRGMLTAELIDAFNGSKSSKHLVDALLSTQQK